MRVVIAEAGVEYRVASDKKITTPQDAANQVSEIADSETECMTVILLNSKNGMLSADIVTNGLVDSSLAHPREVFRRAISLNAKFIILAHNHPSGDVTPSAEDIRITKQLVEAGRILDIKMLDHVVIGKIKGELKICSLRDNGLVSFD